MSNQLLILVMGAATAALALSFGVPQWLHVRRTDSIAGVSLASTTNTLVSTVAWMFYGLYLHDFWVTVTSIVGLPALIATFIAVIRRSDDRPGMWLPLVWAGLLAAGALAIPWYPAAFAALLGGSILWFVTPAAIVAWRSADVDGIAQGTWLLLALDGLVAGCYGLLAGVTGYVVYAAIAVVGAIVVLSRVWWRWSPDCGLCAPLTRCTCTA